MSDDKVLALVSYTDGHDPKVTEWDAEDPGGNGETESPWVFFQWKGTDVCLDLNCRCGELTHIDAEFVYAMQCGHCGRIYDMPSTVELRERVPVAVDPTTPEDGKGATNE